MNKTQEIKIVASRIDRILKRTVGMPMCHNFWEDLDTLLNLILEEEKGE